MSDKQQEQHRHAFEDKSLKAINRMYETEGLKFLVL